MEHSFREGLRREREKWKRLTGRQRWSYFQTYYLSWTLGGLFILACLLFWLGDVRESHRELEISGLLVNCRLSQEGQLFLTQEYLEEKKEEDGEKGRAYLVEEYILFEGAEDALDQYRRVMALSAQVAAGELDYLILDKAALEGLTEGGIFADPGEFLDEKTLQALEERWVWTDAESEEERARVLSLEGSAFAESFALSPGEAFLAFTCVPEREEKAANLAEYLLLQGML